MAKKVIDSASNNAQPARSNVNVGEEIAKHYDLVERVDGVIINPYQPRKPIPEGGFTALVRGILHKGGKGKVKVEVFPHPERPGELQALLYDNSEIPQTITPAGAIDQFTNLVGISFIEADPVHFDH
jgi:hypothetical protein